MRLTPTLAVAAAILLAAAAPQPLHYPATPVIPVADNYFGTTVTDPYRWLEDGSSPKVVSWAHAQTAIAKQYIESQASYASFSKRIRFLSQGGQFRFGLTIRKNHFIYFRDIPPESQPELVTRDGLHGTERVLFNPNKFGPSGSPAPSIESVFVSLDGAKVAFTTQQAGAEEETMRVVDVQTGRLLPDVIAHAGGGTSPTAIIWDKDGNGFAHTRFPLTGSEDDRHFNLKFYYHALGTDPSTDTYVFGDGQPRNAEYYVEQSSDGDAVALFVDAGDGVHAAVYTKYGTGTFQQVADPNDSITANSFREGGGFVGGNFYLVTTKRHANGEIVVIPPGKTFADATVKVSAGKYSIDGLTAVSGGFITSEVNGGVSVAQYYDADGKRLALLPLPTLSTINGIAADPSGGDIIVRYSSYNTPARWLRYDIATNRLPSTGIQNQVPGDYSQVTVKRVFVQSLDGTAKIPLAIVALRSTKLGPTTPTILTAYGSYGIISRPFFIGPLLAWLEHGGVFTEAMIRGGGEYGEAWHTAAVHATVYKRSDDLAACAGWLGKNGYGDARHLGIQGGSAGGYLMGLALTRNPSLYRAVISDVGFYSELREVLTPNGAFNTPEFGDPKDPKQFSWVYSYSPYYHVKRGVAYPAILMETGENDPRVAPRESRKMIAQLQSASTSAYPILLWQKSGEGHGIGNSLDQEIAGLSQQLTFFESQLRR